MSIETEIADLEDQIARRRQYVLDRFVEGVGADVLRTLEHQMTEDLRPLQMKFSRLRGKLRRESAKAPLTLPRCGHPRAAGQG